MNDQIDREKVIKRFWALDIKFTPKQINALKNLLEEDETLEKRGKWIKTRYGYLNGMPIYKCSNCTTWRLSREDGDMTEYYLITARFPYCPNCGAKMEQEERK